MLAILFLLGPAVATQAQPVFVADDGKSVSEPIPANEGYTRLRWTPPEGAQAGMIYELQKSGAKDFSNAITLYRGPDLASFVSGLPAGQTWYRVRATDGPWSTPVAVDVTYIETSKVMTGLIAGTAMLLFTVVYVVISHLKTKNARIG